MNNAKGTLLLVDDDDVFRQTVARSLIRRGYAVEMAASGEDALSHSRLLECDAALVDLRMPGMDGLELIEALQEKSPNLPVIVLTGHGTISTAIEAIKIGAFHYLTKPCDIQEIEVYVSKAIQQSHLQTENVHLRDAMQRGQSHPSLIGESEAIRHLHTMIDRVKDAQSPVLVLGESGTGKELVARALHDLSQRSDQPFIALNCATLKPELLENELFGHVAGAFTGATQNKEGLLAVANQGTLFIDEIADMDPNVQASLLRVLETGEYRPLGATQLRTTQTRLIAAANRDLAQEVSKGRFREDLYYRLNVIVITTPCLRDHKQDIPTLVEHYVQQSAAARHGVRFSSAALQALQEYHWPGNVRELFNICERAILLSGETEISAETVRSLVSMTNGIHRPSQAPTSEPANEAIRPLEEMESEYIQKTLDKVGGNISRASELLKIDRRTLQRKLKRLGNREEGPD